MTGNWMIKIYVTLCFLLKAYTCRCVFKENTRARYDPALSIHEDDCANRILYVPSDSFFPSDDIQSDEKKYRKQEISMKRKGLLQQIAILHSMFSFSF